MGLRRPMCRLAIACLVLSVAGCASAPVASNVTTAQIEKAAGVEPGALIMYAPTTFASANGGRMTVDFSSGVFAQTREHIHILSYDRISTSFRRDMSFNSTNLLGIALVPGPLGKKQLHIQTESGLVACEIGGFLNGNRVVNEVYDRLIAAGTRTFESPGWVSPVVPPQPVVIPIYIPR